MTDITWKVPAAPALPNAPDEYERQFVDSQSKILRIYFNQLNAALGNIRAVEMSLANDAQFNQRYTNVMS